MKQKAKTAIKIVAAVYAVVVVVMAVTALQEQVPPNDQKVARQVQQQLNALRKQAREQAPRYIRDRPINEDEAAEIFRIYMKSSGRIISVNFTMVMQWLNFAVLLLVLYAFAWDPLLEFLDQRRQSIQDEIDEAEADREKARELRRKREKQLAEIKQERADIIEQGRREAEQEREKIRQRAQEEAERIVEGARERMDEEARQARSDLQSEVVDLASDIAERVVERELNREDHDRIFEEMIEQFSGEELEAEEDREEADSDE